MSGREGNWEEEADKDKGSTFHARYYTSLGHHPRLSESNGQQPRLPSVRYRGLRRLPGRFRLTRQQKHDTGAAQGAHVRLSGRAPDTRQEEGGNGHEGAAGCNTAMPRRPGRRLAHTECSLHRDVGRGITDEDDKTARIHFPVVGVDIPISHRTPTERGRYMARLTRR